MTGGWGVAWYWARSELRRRGRGWLAVALLAGLGGGLVLASLSGARRTHTAYPRLIEWSQGPDIVIDPDFERGDSSEFLEVVADLPAVSHRSDAFAAAVAPVVDGVLDIGGMGNAMVSADGDRYYQHDRVRVRDGRLPDPDRPDEILVSTTMADAAGIEVGDRLDYAAVGSEELFGYLEAGAGEVPATAGTPFTFEVVGTGVFPDMAVLEEADPQERILLTPAFGREMPSVARLWDRTGLHLAPGADLGAVRRDVQAIASDMGGSTLFEVRAEITARAQRAARPYVLALSGLGVAGAVFAGLLTVQAVRRLTAESEREQRLLEALAADRLTIRNGLLIPAAIAAVVATATAVTVAALVSPATPVGAVRSAEVEPGVSLDWIVALPVLAVLALAVLGPVAAGIRRGERTQTTRAGWLAGRARQAGAPWPFVLGVERATGVGPTDRLRAARSGLVTIGLSLTMLVAVLTFAGALRHLITTPELHGWNSDVALLGGDGYGSFDLAAAAQVEGLESMTGSLFGTIGVNGHEVPGMGTITLVGSWSPPVTAGRPPAAGEVLLGETTLHEVGATIGDTVEISVPDADEPIPMVVAGTAVLPGLGQIDNDRPTLSEGVVLALTDEMASGITLGWAAIFADVDPALDEEQVTAELTTAAHELSGDTRAFSVYRPSDIAAFARLGRVPYVLMALFAIVAGGSLLHALTHSARRGRRDDAVIAALGAAPSSLRGAVIWQAMTTLAIALVVALPLGLALGRWTWRSLSDQLGLSPATPFPAVALAGLVGVLLALGFAVTAVNNRRFGHRRPGHDLRAQ